MQSFVPLNSFMYFRYLSGIDIITNNDNNNNNSNGACGNRRIQSIADSRQVNAWVLNQSNGFLESIS